MNSNAETFTRAERISSGTAALRELWNAQGVPEARQNEMLAEIEAKAQPGAKSEASAAWDAKYDEQEAMYRREHGAPATYADYDRADREAERDRGERIISSPGYEPGDDPDAEIAAAYEARNDDALDDVFATSTTTKESEHTVENKYSPFDADAATDAEGRPLFASDPEPEGPAYSNPEADALGEAEERARARAQARKGEDEYGHRVDDPEHEAMFRTEHGIPDDVKLDEYQLERAYHEAIYRAEHGIPKDVSLADHDRDDREAETAWKAEHMSEGDGLDPHERAARDIAKVREAARERGERIISAPGYVLGSNRHAEIAAAPDDPEAVIDGELGKVLAWSVRHVGPRVADALTGPVAAAGGVLADALAGVASDDPAREITAHTPITAHTSEAEIAQIDTARDAADRADAADAARMRDEILDRYDREEKAAAARQELDSIPEIDDPDLDPELDDELGPEL